MPKISEVYRLLLGFNNKDFNDFNKFLESPYLNSVEALSLIFKDIRKNKHLMLESKFDELESLLIKNSKYSKSTVAKLLSYLKNSVLKYYGIKSVLADDIYYQIKINEYLLNIGEFKILFLNQNKLNSIIVDSNKIDDDRFLFSHLHNINLYDTSIISGKYYLKDNMNNLSEEYLFNSSTDLFLFTLIQIVSNYVTFILQQSNFNKDNLLWASIDIDDLIKTGDKYIRYDKIEHRIIFFNLYKKLFYAYKFITKDEYYHKYKSYFFDHIMNFSYDKIEQHYKYLTYYCIARERIADKNNYFSHEWMNLTNQFIDIDFINKPSKKNLHPNVYHNFIIKCSAVNDSSKLKEFIDKNTSRVSPKEYRNLYNFGMAHYYNIIADYGKALKCINNVKINCFMFKYDLVKLELQIYFEKSNIDFIERTVHNINEMIKHDSSITKYDKTRLFNMLKYYQALIYLKKNYY